MIHNSINTPFVFTFLFIMLQVSGSGQNHISTNEMTAKQDTSGVNLLVEKVMSIATVKKEKYSITTFPTIEYSTELGLAMGVLSAIVIHDTNAMSKAKYYRPTTIVPSFAYSTQNHLVFDTDIIMYTQNNWLIFSRLALYQVPSSFYGIGSPQNIESTYDLDTYANVSAFMKSINNTNYLGVMYDIGYVNHSEIKEKTLDKDITGYDGGFHIGLGIRYQYDNRDDILYPSQGNLLILNSNQYFGDYNFNLSSFDFRHYSTLFSNKNILASQFSWSMAFGNAPFYKLPKLGGKSNLRSINNSSKYINNHSYYLQTEYRRQLSGRFGAVLFVGAGSSASNFNHEYIEDIVYEYGLGFRFRILQKDKLNFRLDLGLGDGTPTFFMTIREAF